MSTLAFGISLVLGSISALVGLVLVVRTAVSMTLHRELHRAVYGVLAHREHVTRVERSLDWIAGQHCVSYLLDGRSCDARTDLVHPCVTCFARRAVLEDQTANAAAFAAPV
jgi:hypothetical protein